METLTQDLRFAFRSLRRNPSFAIVALLSLALGIGANTAMFSVLDALLLRPLPLPHPETLVRVLGLNQDGSTFAQYSYPDYQSFRDRSRSLSGLAGYAPSQMVFTSDRPAARLEGEQVTGNYFGLLGTRAAKGRLLGPADDRRGSTPRVVLSHRLWRERFAGDPDLVGRPLLFDGRSFIVAGVAAESFHGMTRGADPDYWIPTAIGTEIEGARMDFNEDLLTTRHTRWIALVGRLAPGVTLAAAGAQLNAVGITLMNEPPPPGVTAILRVLPGGHGDPYQVAGLSRIGVILMAVVALVLLLASFNVANLLLARATSRRREIAVRLAVGGSRGRIVRQLLTESVLLATLGAAAGLLIAVWSLDVLRLVFANGAQPLALDLRLDGRVLLFTSLLSLVTGVLFGLAPAIQATRPEVVPSLKGEPGRAVWRSRLRTALVVGQVAISLALLVGSGLFVRSLRNLQAVDLGYDPKPLWTAAIQLGPNVPAAQARQFYSELLARLAPLPGIERMSFASVIQPNEGGMSLSLDAADLGLTGTSTVSIDVNNVGPGFFSTLGLPVVRGREFTARDSVHGTSVAIINQTLERRLAAAGDPLGRAVHLFGGGGAAFTVVGVVKDTKYRGLTEEATNCAYVPMGRFGLRAMSLVVRGGDPAELGGDLRVLAQQIDPDVPVFRVESLPQKLARVTSPSRLSAMVLTLFGALALLIATLGIYGTFTYMVGLRTHEIGVRMALGAKHGDVLRMVLGHGVQMVVLGVAIGGLMAIAAGRLIASQLYGITPTDGATLAVAPLVLVPVALLACFVPARRATHVDPVVALRHE